MTEILDGSAEEIDAAPQSELQPEPEPSRAIALVEPAAGAIISAEQPEEILAKATTIANALKGLIDSQGLAASVGGNRKHVEVGAWQACGTLLGALGGQPLHAETVWTRKVTGDDGLPIRTQYTAIVKRGGSETTYDVDGYDWEACVEVRTPSGVVVGRAEAMCGRAENTWAKRDDYAVRSMAETRAESRAYRRAIGWIVHLAGYSPTPAEEMPPASQPTGPAHGPAVSQEEGVVASTALTLLVGGDVEKAREAWGKIKTEMGGYFPHASAVALIAAAPSEPPA